MHSSALSTKSCIEDALAVYDVALREISRQVAVQCAERGALLVSLWEHAQSLLHVCLASEYDQHLLYTLEQCQQAEQQVQTLVAAKEMHEEEAREKVETAVAERGGWKNVCVFVRSCY